MTQVIFFFRRLLRLYKQDEITVYAAQASFFLILAFFPFIMLLLTLIQFIPAVSKSDLLAILVRIMPDALDSLVVGIVDDLTLKSPATMISVTAVAALWSAARGIMGIERGLNRIYGTTDHHNYLMQRLICTGYTFLFTFVCVASLALLVFGDSLHRAFMKTFPLIGGFIGRLIDLRQLLAAVILLAAFVLLYTLVPEKKQNPWKQIPGAVFSVIGWLLFSYGFSLYINGFSNYSYMYGSLAAVILLMLWLYFCICILFIGGLINAFLR